MLIQRLARLVFQFHANEVMALRNSILMSVLVPLTFMVGAIFAGEYNFGLKKFLILVGMSYCTFRVLQLSARRLVIGTEIATLLQQQRLLGFLRVANWVGGATTFVNFIGRVVTAQIVVFLLVLVARGHEDPLSAFIMLFIAIGLITWSLSYGGGEWWPGFALTVMVVSLIGMAFPMVWPTDQSWEITLGWRVGSHHFPTAGWFMERSEIFVLLLVFIALLATAIYARQRLSGSTSNPSVAAPAASKPAAAKKDGVLPAWLMSILVIGFSLGVIYFGFQRYSYGTGDFGWILLLAGAAVAAGLAGGQKSTRVLYLCGFLVPVVIFIGSIKADVNIGQRFFY